MAHVDFASAFVSDVASYIQSHNSRRCLHATSDLTWSNSVETSAQAYADTCTFSHSTTSYGENLYAGSANPTAEDVLNGWYNSEIGSYDYNNPGFSSGTGHFTQV